MGVLDLGGRPAQGSRQRLRAGAIARLITAIAVRDTAISLGITDPRARAKAVGVAAGWGTACLIAGLAAGRSAGPHAG